MLICKRFFGVLSCFFFLLLAPINNDSLAACGTDPDADSVKVAGYAYTSTSIQDAYNYASTTLNLPSFTLQLAGQIFTEDLLLDGGAVVLDGGYDCSFATKTSPSSVFGTIIIRNGSLNVAAGTVSPKVVSTDQTTFDRDGDGFTSIGSTSGSADDCNDNDSAINPGAIEICDGLDNNCDGQADEGLTGTDADGDGYYAIGSCGAVADDCNDNDPNIFPGAPEIPYDGIDQDCSNADLTFANGNACADCHHPPDNLLDSVHNYRSAAAAADGSCVLCHAGPVSSILSGHYGRIVRTQDVYFGVPADSTINCWTCHDDGSHSGGFPLGDGQGEVWDDVLPPYPNQYSCDDCHADRAARHVTATAHNSRVIDSTCANCHTSPSSGTLASAADVDALHGVAGQATDCAICHNYSGTLLDASIVRQMIQSGLSGTQISCLNCHTDKGTGHGNFTHPIEVGPNDLSYNPGQLCSACHVVANWTEIEGTEHNVATNGAGSCATCHSSPRQEVQNVIADAPSYGGYPIRCLACHADKELTVHGNVDHVALDYVTRGTSFCLDCHDPGTAANATVDITHNGTCSLCHTTIPALQPGVPAGGGDCVTCHTVTWQVLHMTNPPDHSALVTTTGTDNCASCHADALIDVTTHLSDCSNCHNASDGTLVTTYDTNLQTFDVGGNCETCHTDSWEVTHTTNTPDHGFLVRVNATSCGDCHSDPPPLTDNADPKVHDACASCHNTNGSLVTLYDTSLQTFVAGGDCATCHTEPFDNLHVNHVHTVAEGAGDLSFDPPGTPCSDCHVVSTWAEIEGTEHNVATNGAGSCATCHSSPRQEVINAIVAAADPTNCLACHDNKDLTVHGGIDHVASGDVTLATACADCHNPGGTANATVDITHAANCTLCHTNVPTLQEGVPAGPANCATCHSAAWNVTHLSNTPDHSSLITTFGTNCANCHADAFIDASTHLSDCSNCHNVDGSLVTIHGTDNQTFAVGGNCLTCHTGRDWTDHDIDHATAGYVTLHSECTSCHAATLTAGADFINPADDEKHNACTSCHGANGAIATGSVDCSACHSGETTDWTTHAQDHTTLVTQQTECSSCHTATVEYANFVDPTSNVKHDTCYTCHDNTTKLASAAAGDCTQCHTANYFDSHQYSHDVSYNPLTDTSQTTQQGCATCHDDNGGALANWTDIYVEHLGNCATCHSYTDDGFGTPVQTTVETTIASGTSVTCATCHTPKVPDTDHGVDHIASAYVTGEAACLVCHVDPATTFTDPANAKIHDDCTTCHDSGTNALIGSATSANPGGPNTCTTCHTGRDWTDHDIDHATAGYVTLHSECTSCHAATLTAGADFINPADDEKHNACTSCHGANGAIATGSVDCSACHSGETTDWTTHAQDHTTLVTQQTECSSCHTATVEYANFVDPTSNVKHDTCYTCHDNTTKLASAAAGDCTQCHTANYFDSHQYSHDVSYNPLTDTSQTTQQGCAVCHDDNGGALANWTDIYVEHLGNCATCHSYTDDGFGTPVQTTVETTIASGTSVTCATCHTPKVPDTDHGVDHIASAYVTGEAACLVCHVDPATTFTDPANAKIHDDCTTCHDSGTNALIGSATSANPGGPNTCTTCHTGRDWTDHDIDHATAGYVTLHSECTSCHAATLTAGADFINPADDEKHNACTSCHGANGAIATGSVDCSACHSGETTDWTTHAQDHTTLVTQQTECSSCHTATVEYANFVDPTSNVKHDTCYTCHDNTTKLASAAAGDCTQCHTANYFDSHQYSHDVSYNPLTDTSQTTQQGCAVCHDDNGGALANWTDIYVEHLGNCATCHSYTDDGFGTPVQTTVETTIASGTSVTCATCHTPKVPDTDHGVDHIASAYVTGEAACLVCHVDPATTFTDPANAKIHDDCTTCHDSGTNALIGSATSANPGGPNTCTTCHTGRDWTDHDIDHATAGYVTLHSECTSCHAATLTAGADFINPADDEKHNACTSCHGANGAIATGSVDCSACHSGETTDWTTHAQDHTTLVTQQTECSSCHTATVEYANFVDPTSNVKHDTCYTCHDNTTKLASAAAGDCTQCHTANYFDSHQYSHDVSYNPLTDTSQTTQQGCAVCHDDNGGALANWTDIYVEHLGNCATCHSYTDDGFGTPVQTTVETTIASGTSVTCATCHTPKVPDTDHGVDHIASAYVTGEAACLVCHVDPATTFTDPANAKIHDDCTTCHDSGTNALIGSATSANPGGPNTCTTCHTGRDWTDHDIDHATAGYVTLHSECTSCHAATLTAGADFINPADDEKHNACTSCHGANGAIATGSVDCSACHSGETTDWTTHAQDHTTLVTQQTECSSCHTATVEYANFVDPTSNVKHDTCYTCHDNTTKLASAAAGDCTQCHTANYFDSHQYSHDVSYNPLTDTSQTTQQGCATCHDDNGGALANWTDIYVEHLGNCATCHSYTDDGFGTPVQTTVETTIASGTSVTCATCHTPKVPDTDHGVDHIASAYVTGEAACLVCHVDPATTFTDPANAKIHDDCTTCHDSGTNALIGSATSANPGGPNTCTTCHTGRDWTDHDIDHATAGYVTLHSECTSCHAATLTAGADFINPADDEKHNACTSCHGANGAIATGSVDCSACHSGETTDWTTHAQDHTTLVTQQTECSSCHTATVEYANFVDPTSNVKHDTCYTCHDNTTKLASAAAGDCTQCHTANYFDSHQYSHDVSYNPLTDTSQTTQQGCATCHDDNGGALANWTDIYVEHLGNCATCHSYTDDGFGTPVQTTVETTIASGTSVTCATCHTPKVPDTDHGVDHIASAYVTGEAACLVCHVDPATTFTDPANAKIHDDCTTCHDSGTNALIGSATSANPGGPNTCTTCHTGRDWTDHDIDHATAGYVTLHSECTSCHAATLTAGADFINPADDEKHNACTSCHGANGAIATGSVDCSACHSGETTDWTTHAQDHTTLVTQQTECSSCHTATVEYANFVDPTSNVKHDTCYTCHDNTTKLASAAAGDCTNCHTANYFDSHTHTHDVAYNASTDTSQTTEQGCAVCHDDNSGALASWSDIYVEHLSDCANCHSYDGAATAPLGDVETAISSGNPATCATCHTDKAPSTDHGVDHIGSGFVTGEAACLVCHTDPATIFTDSNDAKVHNGCTTCHDVGTNALIGSAVNHGSLDAGFGNPNVCTTCHTGRDWTDHDIDHATAGYVTLHSECTSCHADTLTAGQGFISPADDEKHNACTSCHGANGAIATGSVDCSACHATVTGDWTNHAQDHTVLVTQATGCASCHSATVDYAAFVDPANNVKHDDCYVCHDNTTKLASAAAGDCSQCHGGVTGDFATHTTQDHTTKVTSATGCSSCHSATVDYAAFVDPANNFKHDSCATCHNATTNAPAATAGDCSQCHSGVTGDFSTHMTQNHSGLVTLQTECNSCHTATVDYANFVDAANVKKHDSCATCHNATTNAPSAAAGDCSQCHTANYFDSHTHSHTVSVGGDESNGQSCDDCHDVTNWTLIEGTEHNVATNGAGSCATCHNSPTQTVIDVIAAGAATTCLDCHTDKTAAHGSIDHVAATYVTVGGTQEYYGTTCASCHDPGGAANATVDITHSGDCALCHTTVPNLQPGVPVGGGDCVTCHTPSEHTLWGRYLDTCSQSGDGTYTCHPSFDGGPGNAFHDAHNPSGGWSDRDSATSGLIYPFASNPEMWQSNWPLNPTCDTCHTSYASPAADVGCNACHNFKTNKKGPLHLRHSDGTGKGGLGIVCTMCHYND